MAISADAAAEHQRADDQAYFAEHEPLRHGFQHNGAAGGEQRDPHRHCRHRRRHQRHRAGGNGHDAKADQDVESERADIGRGQLFQALGFFGRQLALFHQLGNIQRDLHCWPLACPRAGPPLTVKRPGLAPPMRYHGCRRARTATTKTANSGRYREQTRGPPPIGPPFFAATRDPQYGKAASHPAFNIAKLEVPYSHFLMYTS